MKAVENCWKVPENFNKKLKVSILKKKEKNFTKSYYDKHA